jgi:hypothetical protein
LFDDSPDTGGRGPRRQWHGRRRLNKCSVVCNPASRSFRPRNSPKDRQVAGRCKSNLLAL